MPTANRTKTSSFGVKGRSAHDSTDYYDRAIYSGVNGHNGNGRHSDAVSGSPAVIPPHLLNRVTVADAADPGENRLPDNSVHLMVTSPPYCVGKDYDEDLTLEQYLDLLNAVWTETERVLVPGGRVCINIANVGRKPYIPLHSYIIQQMLGLKFNMRGEIIWDKGASAGSSSAWGSWQSASNPCLRDQHEYILVFSKGDYRRKKPAGVDSSIGRDDFLEFTRSVWRFNAESAKRVGHPAPYPVELPRRCIELYTFPGDVIFDPFTGSGTTGVAAVQAGRAFAGYELNPDYAVSANLRIHHSRRLW